MGGLSSLISRIHMPAEAAEKIPAVEGFAQEAALLHGVATFEEGAEKLHELLAPDGDGFQILSVMLREAAVSEEEYRRRGIPETIFLDTMAAFTRFVEEHRRAYGYYGFDRWWWTGRQISLKLFRVGLLEYELCETDGKREVSVHIPSGMPLAEGAVDSSLDAARAFMARYFPAYADAPYTCFSWLLAPVLKRLLPADSRILRFAARFDILAEDGEREDYKTFVFGRSDIPPEGFAEDTSLQRAVKRHVLGGGKVGSAYGVLRR